LIFWGSEMADRRRVMRKWEPGSSDAVGGAEAVVAVPSDRAIAGAEEARRAPRRATSESGTDMIPKVVAVGVDESG
jgi:hypothetical protein